MTASVVTFTVQLGSDGFSIAAALAERLGYRYYDWQITSQTASQGLETTEPSPDFVERLMARLSASNLSKEDVPSWLLPAPRNLAQAMAMLGKDENRFQMEDVVRRLAGKGSCVIVGHASQVILADDPNALKVLVVGSFDRRAERLATEQGTSLAYSRQMVAQLDRVRAEFFRATYGIEWLDASIYDLTLNTDDFALTASVDLVATAVRAREGPSRTACESLPMDPIAMPVFGSSTGQLLSFERSAVRRNASSR